MLQAESYYPPQKEPRKRTSRRRINRKPALVPEETRLMLLKREEEAPQPTQETTEKKDMAAEQPHETTEMPLDENLRTYSVYTENTASEATMLANELAKFQQNGLAGPDSIAIYRKRMIELSEYLKKLQAHADSGAFEDLDSRDKLRLGRLMEKNRSAVRKVEETLKESQSFEASPAPAFVRPSTTEQTPPKSRWETDKKKTPVVEQPGVMKKLWERLKNPSSWFRR